jgi:hypothetical protein
MAMTLRIASWFAGPSKRRGLSLTSNESAEPTFFDVVRIGDSDDARRLGMSGAEGVVIGMSEDEVTGEKWYCLAVGDRPATTFPSSNLTPTGRSVPRESIYSGDSVRVSQDGRILGYTSAEAQPTDDGA